MPSNSLSLSMKDDPNAIAAWLTEEHGLKDAERVVLDSIFKAQNVGDNYGLSVWREVRQTLAKRSDDTNRYSEDDDA